MKYVIYSAYGSNLLKERFMAYIKGGTFEGRYYEGCRDKTNPVSLGWMYVPHRLYFAKSSPRWDNKGVAFITCEKEPNPEYHTVVRLWKIKESQFEDVWEQEGKIWYDKVLKLGEKDGLEIKTITGRWSHDTKEPSETYLDVIRRGLKETTNWSNEEIERYLNKFK